MTPPEKTTALGERARALINFVAAIALFGMAALFYFSGSTGKKNLRDYHPLSVKFFRQPGIL